MGYTQADLDAVQRARLRGVRVVQFADRIVTYSSDSELRQVENDIRRDVAAASQRHRQFVVTGSKGFCS